MVARYGGNKSSQEGTVPPCENLLQAHHAQIDQWRKDQQEISPLALSLACAKVLDADIQSRLGHSLPYMDV